MRHFLNGIPVQRALPTHCASFSSDKGPMGNMREEVYWGCVQMAYSLVRVHILYFIASLVAQLVKKKSTCSTGDLGSISGLRRSLGDGEGYPFQYSGLENSHLKSWTQLSDFDFSLLKTLFNCTLNWVR